MTEHVFIGFDPVKRIGNSIEVQAFETANREFRLLAINAVFYETDACRYAAASEHGVEQALDGKDIVPVVGLAGSDRSGQRCARRVKSLHHFALLPVRDARGLRANARPSSASQQ